MPRQNDIGVVFEAKIVDNGEVFSIPDGATLELRFQKPNGQVFAKTASLQSDGSDGMIQYVSVAGDLDQVGTWRIEGRISYDDNVFSSDIAEFEVKEILRNRR